MCIVRSVFLFITVEYDYYACGCKNGMGTVEANQSINMPCSVSMENHELFFMESVFFVLYQ